MLQEGDSPIPGYQLVRKLGRGQFGEVWEANAPGGTRIAMKFITIEDHMGAMELKAMQLTKRIRHAHLCPVNAIWLLDPQMNVCEERVLEEMMTVRKGSRSGIPIRKANEHYTMVVSMLMADGSLGSLLKEVHQSGNRGIPKETLIEYMEQAAKGLDFLNAPRQLPDGNRIRITHRDIKPDNLLTVGGVVMVGDFGVATAFQEMQQKVTGVAGSLAYMAPEVLEGRPSITTDQYALAITYYHLLTGKLPIEHNTLHPPNFISIHQQGLLKFEEVPDREREVLERATSKTPERRFETCGEFIKHLKEAIRRETEPDAPKPKSWRQPAVLGGVGVVCLAGLVIGLFASGAFDAPTPDRVASPDQADNGASRKTGQGVGTPEPPRKVTRTITVKPAAAVAKVTVLRLKDDAPQGDPIESAEPQLPVEAFDGEELEINIEYNTPLYAHETKRLPVKLQDGEQELNGWTIEATPIGLANVRDEWEKMLREDREQAKNFYLRAAEVHRELIEIPEPTVISSEMTQAPIIGLDLLDEGRIALARGNAVEFWDLTEKSQLNKIELPERIRIRGFAVSPDRQWIAWGTSNNRVVLLPSVSLDNLNGLIEIDPGEDFVPKDLQFSATTDRLFVIDYDGTVVTLDKSVAWEIVGSPRRSGEIFDGSVRQLSLPPSGDLLAVTDEGLFRMPAGDVSDQNPPELLLGDQNLNRFIAHPNGNVFAMSNDPSHYGTLLKLGQQDPLLVLSDPLVQGGISDATFDSNGEILFLADQAGHLHVLPLTQSSLSPFTISIGEADYVREIVVNRQANKLLVWQKTNVFSLWNFEKLLAALQARQALSE